MKRTLIVVALVFFAAVNTSGNTFGSTFDSPVNQPGQATDTATREATREKMRQLLARDGAGIGVSFRQSTKQPFNFVGIMTRGLTNAESLEIVVGVTAQNTINFRIYPHYKGGYINVDKARNVAGLMRQLLMLSDRTFLFWGIDTSGDVFCGYTITLESGFPSEAIDIVLRSIANADKFVGELKSSI